jgi:glycosyltransferase involved in cell wall biosynthesis
MKIPEAAIVIPCYNEAARFDLEAFREFLSADPSIHFVMVNDGSSDTTLSVLQSLAKAFPVHVQVIDQQPNRGKAEAVRIGLLAACDRAPLVGFWDADLATPLKVVPQFVSIMTSRPDIQWVLGSRVKLLGRQIHRSELRHYLGRVFATGASLTLGLGVYDTQCGAKLFRATPLFRSLITAQFLTKWIFDVELIARLAAAYRRGEANAPEEIIFEAPLDTWLDVAGSKVKPTDFIRSGAELARIWWHYLRPKHAAVQITAPTES